MTTYVYETIPGAENEEPEYFELKQNMSDSAYTHHPETGKPVRRVILGGYGLAKKGEESAPSSSGHSCCGGTGCCN